MPSLTPSERELEAALALITMPNSVGERKEASPAQSVDPEAARQEAALALASLALPNSEAAARQEAARALVSLVHSADRPRDRPPRDRPRRDPATERACWEKTMRTMRLWTDHAHSIDPTCVDLQILSWFCKGIFLKDYSNGKKLPRFPWDDE
jgi:hypothetical protein